MKDYDAGGNPYEVPDDDEVIEREEVIREALAQGKQVVIEESSGAVFVSSDKPLPIPHTPDLPGVWAHKDGGLSVFHCDCLHWTPEPRYGNKCPNCGQVWMTETELMEQRIVL